VRKFDEMEVYVRGIVLVPDGPGDDVGGGQVGRIIDDEGLDDWDFQRLSLSPKEGSRKGHISPQNIRLTAVRA
jgi:hypothetical protein